MLALVIRTLLILTLTPMLFALRCQAQGNPLPHGIYTSMESLKNRTPERLDTLTVVNLGHDQPFVLESQSKSVKKGFIRRDMLAYAQDGSVFLNGKKMGLQAGYCHAVTQGHYMAF